MKMYNLREIAAELGFESQKHAIDVMLTSPKFLEVSLTEAGEGYPVRTRLICGNGVELLKKLVKKI
jgi:hypothetical protein